MTRKKLLLTFCLANAALLITAGGYLVLYSSGIFGNSLCLFSRLTHLYCPGCGGTRALFALLRGDVLRSLALNPTTLALGLFILYAESLCLCSLCSGNMRYARSVDPKLLWVLVGLLLGNFIVRNILLLACGIDPIGDHMLFWHS